MIQNELFKAKNKDLIASIPAMKRAAALARHIAVQTGTAIVIVKNEKIIWRSAAELVALSKNEVETQ